MAHSQQHTDFLKRTRGMTDPQATAWLDARDAERATAKAVRKGTTDPRTLWTYNATSGKWERV